jgi:hypothetical protein
MAKHYAGRRPETYEEAFRRVQARGHGAQPGVLTQEEADALLAGAVRAIGYQPPTKGTRRGPPLPPSSHGHTHAPRPGNPCRVCGR